jgi:hypothetical protein
VELNFSDPQEEFAVTFIESEATEMVHRFIRIKDV